MKSTRLASLSLLLLPALPAARAQSAEEFFHRGAQHFISESNAVAKAEVEQGLKLHPNDPKLTKLWELLNQQQQQQQKDDKKQQDQKDKSKQDEQQQDQSKDQQKQEQQKKDEQAKQDQQKQDQKEQAKQQQEQASKPDKKEGEEKKDPKSASRPEQGEPQEPGDGEPQKVRAMRMTPQQAQLLLDAAKSEERTLPIPPDAKPRRKDRVFKDW